MNTPSVPSMVSPSYGDTVPRLPESQPALGASIERVHNARSNRALRNAAAFLAIHPWREAQPPGACRDDLTRVANALLDGAYRGYFLCEASVWDAVLDVIPADSALAASVGAATNLVGAIDNSALDTCADNHLHIATALVKAIEATWATGGSLSARSLQALIVPGLASCRTIEDAKAWLGWLESQLGTLPPVPAMALRTRLLPVKEYLEGWFADPQRAPERSNQTAEEHKMLRDALGARPVRRLRELYAHGLSQAVRRVSLAA